MVTNICQNKYQKVRVLFVYGKHKYTDYIKITGNFFGKTLKWEITKENRIKWKNKSLEKLICQRLVGQRTWRKRKL